MEIINLNLIYQICVIDIVKIFGIIGENMNRRDFFKTTAAFAALLGVDPHLLYWNKI
jgi:hypothetical protein